MKHFEQIWVEAEKLTAERFELSEDAFDELIYQVEILGILLQDEIIDPKKIADNLGQVLFCIAGLSKTYDTDVWKELLKATNDVRVDLMD